MNKETLFELFKRKYPDSEYTKMMIDLDCQREKLLEEWDEIEKERKLKWQTKLKKTS